jgi:hypothetical protein
MRTNPKQFSMNRILGDPPTELVLSVINETTIKLLWTAGSSRYAYIIERSIDNVIFTQVGTAVRTATDYTNTGLTFNTLYYYRIRCYHDVTYSQYSNTANAITSYWYLAGNVTPSKCVAAYRAIGVTDYNSSKVNLVDSDTYELTTPTYLPIWDTVTGWKFNVLHYFNTGFTPADIDITVIMSINDNMTDYSCWWGAWNDPHPSQISNAFWGFRNQDTDRIEFQIGLSKLYIDNISDFANKNIVITMNKNGIYINGLKPYQFGSVGTPDPTQDSITIGAHNYPAWPNGVYGGYNYYMHAFAIYNTLLTDSEILAISNRILEITNDVPTYDGIIDSDLYNYSTTNPID